LPRLPNPTPARPQKSKTTFSKETASTGKKLVDANHHTLDQGAVTFVVPEKIAAEKHQ
jgi:hypothetical protein